MRVPCGSWFRCRRRGLLLWFRRGGECSFVLLVWVWFPLVVVCAVDYAVPVAFVACVGLHPSCGCPRDQVVRDVNSHGHSSWLFSGVKKPPVGGSVGGG